MCLMFFSAWTGEKMVYLFRIGKHAPLIYYSLWNCATSSEIPSQSHVVTWGQHLLSINAPFVGGTWWISEQCSFHLLTAEIAWGCWRVPDKHGLLHASPWSTFSFAPWIHHGLWQHAPFWLFYIIVDGVAAAAGDDDDYDVVEVSKMNRKPFIILLYFRLMNK